MLVSNLIFTMMMTAISEFTDNSPHNKQLILVLLLGIDVVILLHVLCRLILGS
jgi:hypothetical protein